MCLVAGCQRLGVAVGVEDRFADAEDSAYPKTAIGLFSGDVQSRRGVGGD